jgi:hypothetical protein
MKTRHMRRKNKNKGFVMLSAAMLRSPAWRVLSLTGHRILARIIIEHCDHAGKDNGALPVTHQQFRQFGIHDHAVGPGIREVVALGFTEITRRGRAGNAEFRSPTLFRVTFLRTSSAEATNEWAKIETTEEAEATAAMARASTPERKPKRVGGKRRNHGAKNQNPSGGFHH